MPKSMSPRLLITATALLALSACGRSKADQEVIDQLTSQLEQAEGQLADAKDKAATIEQVIGDLEDTVNTIDGTDASEVGPDIREQAGQLDRGVDALFEALGCEASKACE